MNNFPQITNNYQPRFTPPMFMQPQGNVYIIKNSLELANVPMGTGVSVGLCPTESLVYLKMYQNGQPQVSAYSLVPYEKPANESIDSKKINELLARIEQLEKKILPQKEGGNLSEYI